MLRRYHWGFLLGPKSERKSQVPGTKYHVKNHPFDGWAYEEVAVSNVKNTTNLLIRVLIAKVEDEKCLTKIFRTTPVVQGDPNWRCRTWIADALSRIAKDGKCVGTAQLDWSKIEAVARKYVAEKTAAGRYSDVRILMQPKPIWDILEGREILP
ncbi:hypothetical protein O1611_g8323 [Lasiodiplodia mahajangana]|uniref:Uncharacterized protein n=1 Tax=Lasiodiplodia mahajangana TaxID=1108764 RepID=A0ACC2JCR6_9PEZI|nr:hypothetical protein O1611_g8323 [Lasiodiplodia mahajangana]